jgi:hypothetical protein
MDSTAFAFDGTASSGPIYRRKKMPVWQKLIAALLVVGLLGGAGWLGYSRFVNPPRLTLTLPPEQKIDELETLKFQVGVEPLATPPAELKYSLVKPPKGAHLDPATGEFSWTPTEAQGPKTYTLTIRAAVPGHENLHDEKAIKVVVKEVNQPPVLTEIEDRTVTDKAPVMFPVDAKDTDLPPRDIEYTLLQGAPAGATLGSVSGLFEWPAQDFEPGTYPFTVIVTEKGKNGKSVRQTFRIRIEGTMGPLEQLLADLRQEGLEVKELTREPYPPFSVPRRILSVAAQEISVLEYGTREAAVEDSQEIAADASTLFGQPKTWLTPPRFYRKGPLIVLYEGQNAELLASLGRRLGVPFAIGKRPEPKPEPAAATTPSDVRQMAELYKKKKLFIPKEYPTLRKLFAARFEEQFADQIRQGFGTESEAILAWLSNHSEIKEELYTALDPEFDDIPAALKIFQQIQEQFPKKIEPYANLAIAVAVTWDKENSGVYDYTQHQRRTHSTLPPDTAGALENFKYFAESENVMQGRAQYVPWEFLVHLVNHKTPVPERVWAVENYLPSRVMFGKCYKDVPYDKEMLRTESKTCKLDGQPYALPKLRSLGGVCAMQADFAARVGKSLGVPAEYVWGESASGGLHAWVMWVELKQVTKTSIGFTLESYGRYFDDNYYVGQLNEPQTGQRITDRQLELRLQTVGLNAPAKRQADLIMKAYDLIRDEAGLDLTDQILFLSSVIELSPGNEAAWITLSKLSRDNPMKGPNYKLMQKALAMLFKTFEKAPDFTWVVFDDLITFLDKGKERPKLILQLVNLYEAAGRPDLACEARLKLTDYLVEEKRTSEAVEGLAFTIKKFPDEGRYVPLLLDKLEQVCDGVKGADEQLIRFYQQFLPLVPQRRGDSPSEYCMKMYERGIERFQKAGQTQLAQALTAQLDQLRATK